VLPYSNQRVVCSLLSQQPHIKNAVVAYTSQRKLFLLSSSFWVFGRKLSRKKSFLRCCRLDNIETPLSLRKNTSIMGSSNNNESTMKATKEEMKKAGIDLAYRDFCAHLLIPLNECRRKSFFLPWKCKDERHVYEKCQYEEYVML